MYQYRELLKLTQCSCRAYVTILDIDKEKGDALAMKLTEEGYQ
jgi:hypothetical protein